ncbi:hypothetical protein [Croceivirga sp. JEA036]|uniref:hypothetical protein n=1 Tax=Croceivirga sp. JEA036 TaxID=2721162 RepID=UPI00143B9D26|nr:hypothetical protein [Croceivirga sp. JEA036]NJB35401.1 hypothetical protein [Croceivirga sp. JEA036]
MKHFNLIVSLVLSVVALSVSCSNEQEFDAMVIEENEKVLEVEPIEEIAEETTEEEKPYHYLFTEAAKAEIKRRIEQEYVTGPGFTNDFVTIKENVSTFLQAPDGYRPVFGEFHYMPPNRQYMHHSAVYAWAMEEVNLANHIIKEILSTVSENAFNTSFWNSKPNFDFEYSLWVQSSEMEKTKNSYYLIKDIQDKYNTEELEVIENWFSDYANLIINYTTKFDNYLGEDWVYTGPSRLSSEGLFQKTATSTPFPLENKNGEIIEGYEISKGQNLFNNRIVESIAYLHSWAIVNKNLEAEKLCREYFKNAIRFGVWPDGTFWELMRNENVYNISALGVWYSMSTLSALVRMAHTDALKGNFPEDRLYDFSTTEGIIKGSTNFTEEPYPGGSTTDGVTPKSLKTFIIGQSKYYRSSDYGGWNDLRYYKGGALNMEGVNERDYSINQAIANLYYKDSELSDWYLYDTSKGYPTKDSFKDGHHQGDSGNLGTSVAGGLWLEMESYFFY